MHRKDTKNTKRSFVISCRLARIGACLAWICSAVRLILSDTSDKIDARVKHTISPWGPWGLHGEIQNDTPGRIIAGIDRAARERSVATTAARRTTPSPACRCCCPQGRGTSAPRWQRHPTPPPKYGQYPLRPTTRSPLRTTGRSFPPLCTTRNAASHFTHGFLRKKTFSFVQKFERILCSSSVFRTESPYYRQKQDILAQDFWRKMAGTSVCNCTHKRAFCTRNFAAFFCKNACLVG